MSGYDASRDNAHRHVGRKHWDGWCSWCCIAMAMARSFGAPGYLYAGWLENDEVDD